jgi:hypothetical protein
MSFPISLLFVVIVSFAISLFTSSQMLSIGFKSGELSGHGKNLMFFLTRNLHKNEIFIIRKPLLHLRNEPILQKCDVLV